MTQSHHVTAVAAILALASLGFASNAGAADVGKEMATAEKHASLSAGSDKVAAVHVHMHHVLNCLVGEDGDGFDAEAANPCKGQGNGILNDAGDKQSESMERAAELIRIGLEVDRLEPAQHIAKAAGGLLKQAGQDGDAM